MSKALCPGLVVAASYGWTWYCLSEYLLMGKNLKLCVKVKLVGILLVGIIKSKYDVSKLSELSVHGVVGKWSTTSPRSNTLLLLMTSSDYNKHSVLKG